MTREDSHENFLLNLNAPSIPTPIVIEKNEILSEKEKAPLEVAPLKMSINGTEDITHHSGMSSKNANEELFPMSTGFIKIPRSLIEDPRFFQLAGKQRAVVLQLFALATYKKKEVSVNQKIKILLNPGQLFYSIRYIVKACHCEGRGPKDQISVNDVVRTINFLETIGKLRQKLIHKRLLITLTCLKDCEQEKNETDTETDTKLIQNCYKYKEREDREEISYVGDTANADRHVKRTRVRSTDPIVYNWSLKKFVGIEETDFLAWKAAFPNVDIPPAVAFAEAKIASQPARYSRRRQWRKTLLEFLKRDQERLSSRPNTVFSRGTNKPVAEEYANAW